MNIEDKIAGAFHISSSQPGRGDSWILENPNLMELGEDFDAIQNVPSYMLWCVRHPDKPDKLVFDYTINALAEYGRCKEPANSYLNFIHLCNSEQKGTIASFLVWCKRNIPFIDDEQIDRSLVYWTCD